jgi:ketol-acid reductoisomerase
MAPGPVPTPPEVFEEERVSLAPLDGRTVAVLGYGTQGRAQALNLRDSGVAVLVGVRRGGPSEARARADGLRVAPPGDAAAAGDVVMYLVPDEVMAALHAEEVAPRLGPDAALGFAHGFALAFGQIAPEEGRACFLCAPKGQGDRLREAYVAGGGLPGLLAVSDGSPAGTWELAAAYARAIGCLRGGGFRTTFREECVTDQFGEQAVLCGGVLELLQAAFDTLVARGYGAANAYFECVHELKLITDLLHRHGVDGLRRRISPTAAYGGLTRGSRVVDGRVRAELARILDEIETGAFAREFLQRHDDPREGIAARAAAEADTPLARAGRRLRDRLAALGLDGGPAGPPEAPGGNPRTGRA